MKTIMGAIILLCFVWTGSVAASDGKEQNLRREYQEKMEAKLKDFQQKVEELKEKAAGVEKESKEKINQEIEELRKRQEDAKKKLEELKASSSRAWEEMKRQADSAIEEMEKLYRQVKSRLK